VPRERGASIKAIARRVIQSASAHMKLNRTHFGHRPNLLPTRAVKAVFRQRWAFARLLLTGFEFLRYCGQKERTADARRRNQYLQPGVSVFHFSPPLIIKLKRLTRMPRARQDAERVTSSGPFWSA
jgi:hypothetical protein